MRHLRHALALMAVIAAPGVAAAEDASCTSGEPDARIAACTTVIEAPGTPPEQRAEAYFRRALSWSQFNQYERAIRDYDNALKINPGDAAALNNRAYSWLKLGNPSQALPDVEQALKMAPESAIFMSTRGEILQALGDRAGALRDHEAAMWFGGRFVVKGYQCSLRLARLYDGPVDGLMSPDVSTALQQCVDQGDKCAPVPSFLSTECLDPVG